MSPIFALKKRCIKPFPPVNGLFTGSNRVGGFIHFKCEAGFAMVGPKRALCLRNGLWSVLAPKCKRKILIQIVSRDVT